MREQTSQADNSLWILLRRWSERSERLFIKKLSRNDQSWAEGGGHQSGFYIPRQIRESGFFPGLSADNPEKPHILHVTCPTVWPQTGEYKRSHMRHFTNKGTEAHFTVVPRELFAGLSPASLLVCGRLKKPVNDAYYWLVTIDSQDDTAEIIETILDLEADFHFNLFTPSALVAPAAFAVDETEALIDALRRAIATGQLDAFIEGVARIPSPEELATLAREKWLADTGHSTLNPFALPAPGDALMRISRDIEFRVFKRFELRRRAAEVVRILLREPADLVGTAVRGFPDLDAVFLSASQQRKTRAGRSFENHIACMLRDGSIRFTEQAVLGGRRPDFVMPDSKTLTQKDRAPLEALVLSAKTTLRERWKQVHHEKLNCEIFLATVDDRVPASVIAALAAQGIRLVVPESLKADKSESCYAKHTDVISFGEFFTREIGSRRPFLLSHSLLSAGDLAI